ncbi:MAG: tripartite tricarboxylate transporter TctB family protein [Spirochaetaceae bacterium]|nr:tripartite tricarboxylate transporter TctB family protein [Spirochaetaceae bacterium]
MSFNMPRLEEKDINPYTAPGVVPAVLGIIITIMALALFIRTIAKKDFLPHFSKASLRANFTDPANGRLIITTILCLLYALVLIGRLPYIISTFLFIMAFILLFELKFDRSDELVKKIIIKATIQSVIITAAVASSFKYLFLVDLP